MDVFSKLDFQAKEWMVRKIQGHEQVVNRDKFLDSLLKDQKIIVVPIPNPMDRS